MTMTDGLFITFWVIASVAAVAVLIAHMLRTVSERKPSGRDSELHRRRAEADFEIEEHDIDDMLDAIAEHRSRAGHRAIGDELADDLLREG
jgi:hypothetical protein